MKEIKLQVPTTKAELVVASEDVVSKGLTALSWMVLKAGRTLANVKREYERSLSSKREVR